MHCRKPKRNRCCGKGGRITLVAAAKRRPRPFPPLLRPERMPLPLLLVGTQFLSPRLAVCAIFPCPRLLECWLGIHPWWQILGGDCQGLGVWCKACMPSRGLGAGPNEQQQLQASNSSREQRRASTFTGATSSFWRQGHGHTTIRTC